MLISRADIQEWVSVGDGPADCGPRYSDRTPKEASRKEENEWGKRIAAELRNAASDSNVKKKLSRKQDTRTMWTGDVGESVIGEVLLGLGYELRRHPKIETSSGNYVPDYEILGVTPRIFVEVKAQTWNTSGTAGEKIAAVPFKYMPLCELGRVLVVTIAGAEREAEKLCLFQEPWVGVNNSGRARLLQYIESEGISYCRGSDLLSHWMSFEPQTVPDIKGMTTPLIKWVGGKQKLAQDIAAKISDALAEADEYYEPFVGAGGFLYYLLSTGALAGKKVVAADSNLRLVEFHTVVQTQPDELIGALQGYQYEGGSKHYDTLKAKFNEGAGDTAVARAATFYVLMRSSFNGMYRENSKGIFNVPIGRPCGLVEFKLTPAVAEAIRSASRLTKDVVFIAQDYLESLKSAAASPRRVFVYADPPYEGTFKGYSCAKYDTARLFREIAHSGVAAAVSNSEAGEAVARGELPTFFEVDRFNTKYSVGAASHTRGGKSEVLIRIAAPPPAAPPPAAPSIPAALCISDDELAALMEDLGIAAD